MTTFRYLIALLTLITVSWPARATVSPSFKLAVNEQVRAARRIAPEIGVAIIDLESGEPAYSYQADTLRIIASNTKLFTTAAALDRLGPGFFFETRMLAQGAVHEGTLHGDLAVVGGGDPNLSGRHYNGDSLGPFREWAQALAAHGIVNVAGDLRLVHGFFDSTFVHPDWPSDQLDRWYEAPVAALSFNDNCVLVKVEPGGAAGSAARLWTVPPLDLFRLENLAKVTNSRKQQWLDFKRQSQNGSGDLLSVRGRIYRRSQPVDRWLAVSQPLRYFAAALRRALTEEGIEVSGDDIFEEHLPDADWRPVYTHRSDLLTTLEVINKRSQNFYAESLMKLLGARFCGEGSWPSGVRVVKDFLTESGLDAAEYRLADGSGMSRNNRFSPQQLTSLLRRMFDHRWGREFVATLPYSGERDLRWAKRLATAPYRGNVLAKTGSLNGVSTLSGYAKARSGRLFVFSLLMNRTHSNWQARDAQDRILKALIDHG